MATVHTICMGISPNKSYVTPNGRPIRLTEGKPLVITTVQDAALDADVTLAGGADAIYRALYVRPSHAIVSGDESLLAALPRP